MSRHRRYILVAVFVLLAAAYAGPSLLQRAVHGPLEARRARTDALRKQVRAGEAELAKIRQAGKQLEVWQTQSLPSKAEVARSFYQAWLVELVRHVRLDNPTVDSAEPANRKDMYHVLAFTVKGRGTLEQIAKLLFEFYRAGHLHQIRSLDIAPEPRGGLLSVSLAVEALALAGLKGKTRLNPGPADRLVDRRLDDYLVVARRNVFGAGGGEAVTGVRLTAVTSAAAGPQAWFSFDRNGETVRLCEGEMLEVGGLRATVAEIHDSDVLLEVDGDRWLLTIGESLYQAAAVPPEF